MSPAGIPAAWRGC